jgi:hypothetical protein
MVFSSLYNTGRWKKSKNPVILSIIYHCKNPLKSSRDKPFLKCENIQQFRENNKYSGHAGFVGSNPTPGIDVCVRLFCVCAVLCVGSGHVTGKSLV